MRLLVSSYGSFITDLQANVDASISDLTGTLYKILDDLLDGIFCAYLAFYFWYWGEEGCWVVGDTENGYVTLPRCQLRRCPLLVRVD